MEKDTAPVVTQENNRGMAQIIFQTEDSGGHMDVYYIYRLFINKWRWLAASAILGLLIGFVFYLVMTPKYEAQTTVVSSSMLSSRSNQGNIGGGLGSIASIANLGGAGDSKITLANQILKSFEFIFTFVERNNLASLLLDTDAENFTNEQMWRAAQKFRNNVLSVELDELSGSITISAEWTDPATSASWANGIAEHLNNIYSENVRRNSSQRLEYLMTRLEESRNMELQQFISQLVQMELYSLAEADNEEGYALWIIDHAIPRPEGNFTFPNKTLSIIFGLLLGITVGITAVLIVDFHSRSRKTE